MGKIYKRYGYHTHKLSENAILNRLPIATFLLSRQRKKTHLRTHTSPVTQEVQKWMDEWTTLKDTAFYHRGIALLSEKLEKVVKNGEHYFD